MSRLTVIAGPTAVGKGTVVQYMLSHFDNVHLSVSATTRAPRPGEVDGRDYFFVTAEKFDEMIADGEMLEYAIVHGVHKYGTPKTLLILWNLLVWKANPIFLNALYPSMRWQIKRLLKKCLTLCVNSK